MKNLSFAGLLYKLTSNARLLQHVGHVTTVTEEILCLFDCMNTLGCLSVNVWSDESAGLRCELNNATMATVRRNDISYAETYVYYELDITHCSYISISD